MIETVLGPVAPEELGPTSMHEHLLWDVRGLGSAAAEPLPADPRVTIENLGFLRFNPLALDDNLMADDPGLAAAELRHVAAAGQRAVVDLTVWGFGGPSALLPRVSRASGVQIVAGVGAYLGRTQPDWLTALDVDGLTELFVGALDDHLPGCAHRAGIVGLVGLGHPAVAAEERAVRAAGAAAAATGTSVVARLDPRAGHGLALLDLLAAEGTPPDRVVLSNVDGHARDAGVLRALAATGATLKWSFGYEAPPRVGMSSATDAERITALCALLEDGATRQVLAGSVWTKNALRRYGGHGYDHLALRVVPALRARGLTAPQLAGMLVDEPRRLLDRGAPRAG